MIKRMMSILLTKNTTRKIISEELLEEVLLEFEKKIQEMSFNYTRNIDDARSDHLKRYLEVRMDCQQEQFKIINAKIEDIYILLNQLEAE